MVETWTQAHTAEVYEKQIRRYLRTTVEAVIVASPENIYNRHQLLNCVLVALTKSLCEVQQAIDPSLTELMFAHKLAADLVATYRQWDAQRRTVDDLRRLGQ
jgi:hypothetical protein